MQQISKEAPRTQGPVVLPVVSDDKDWQETLADSLTDVVDRRERERLEHERELRALYAYD